MTLMFAAFEGSALILRVYGTARAIHPRDPEWDALSAHFAVLPGRRQIFDLSVELVQTSCGTGVPEMSFVRSRAETELFPFYDKMGPDGVEGYWAKKNSLSIDGAPTGIFEDGE